MEVALRITRALSISARRIVVLVARAMICSTNYWWAFSSTDQAVVKWDHIPSSMDRVMIGVGAVWFFSDLPRGGK
jgi:hypothetical protein